MIVVMYYITVITLHFDPPTSVIVTVVVRTTPRETRSGKPAPTTVQSNVSSLSKTSSMIIVIFNKAEVFPAGNLVLYLPGV